MVASAALVSLILPCRNQADHIEAVLARYRVVLEERQIACEVILVPNASTDATAALARDVAANWTSARVVELQEGGWGRAVLAGLHAARGDTLCYTNLARTDPAVVAKTLEIHRARPETLVKAARVERGAPMRQAGSWLYNFEARVLFGLRTRDVNGTPKVFGRFVWQRVRLTEVGDLLDLQLLVEARRLGVEILEHPVAGFMRHGGRSTTGLASAWRMYRGAVALKLPARNEEAR